MIKTALIVGAGDGISGAVAQALAEDGYELALMARHTDKLASYKKQLDAKLIQGDASVAGDVQDAFRRLDEAWGRIDVVLYNPSRRARGGIVDLDPEEVRGSLMTTAFGAFLVAQEAARRMLRQGSGAILFTGASAGVKGYARSAPFAMGKFALRGLAQSLARELQPQNIHIAHFVIDGAVGVADDERRLDPAAIAQTYLAVLHQPRSAWSWEIELRPWVETF